MAQAASVYEYWDEAYHQGFVIDLRRHDERVTFTLTATGLGDPRKLCTAEVFEMMPMTTVLAALIARGERHIEEAQS